MYIHASVSLLCFDINMTAKQNKVKLSITQYFLVSRKVDTMLHTEVFFLVGRGVRRGSGVGGLRFLGQCYA